MTRETPVAHIDELTWIKSSHSSNEGGECVEVAHTPAHVLVRDSKNPTGPRLSLTPAMWTTFLSHSPR